MKKVILFLMAFFIVGCYSKVKRLELKPYAKLSSPSILINTPSSFPKDRWKTYGDTLYNNDNIIQLFRKIPNMMSENLKVSVRFIKQSNYQDHKMFFDKNFDFEKWGKEVLIRPNVVANMKERGVKYSKKYVDYIGGLRCTTDAESSSPALGVGFKKYYTVCGYYDTNGNKKRVDIMYHYISSFGGTKFQSDTTSTITSSKDIEVLFKQDMKAIFDSLVIHDMDRTRMQKAGLLHDRAYDVNSEYK